MGCSHSVMLYMKVVRSNRARPERASETSRMSEPNGAFSSCACSHERVLITFLLTLVTRADIT